ncbi:hypothetical protein EVAR_32742_1 [Eumeta japonica]|uniref:Uncharacterized protein n=1 Tax=Eumeta variegata TaxID=151549 RepID=A0A4C1XPT8_EUMVA|nr:hypothetical protein EVAR_32742_1 [Eumeta japonica]
MISNLKRDNISDFGKRYVPTKEELFQKLFEAKRRVSLLKVVNDTAERAVKLMQDFNELIAAEEEQKQFLLRCVQEHRNFIFKRHRRGVERQLRVTPGRAARDEHFHLPEGGRAPVKAVLDFCVSMFNAGLVINIKLRTDPH